jgi:hypothetical protein
LVDDNYSNVNGGIDPNGKLTADANDDLADTDGDLFPIGDLDFRDNQEGSGIPMISQIHHYNGNNDDRFKGRIIEVTMSVMNIQSKQTV